MVTNKAAANVHIQVFVCTQASIFLMYIFTGGIGVSYSRCKFNLLRNFQVV